MFVIAVLPTAEGAYSLTGREAAAPTPTLWILYLSCVNLLDGNTLFRSLLFVILTGLLTFLPDNCWETWLEVFKCCAIEFFVGLSLGSLMSA